MATLESLGLVGTIAEGDVVPVDSESDESENEEVGPGSSGSRGPGRCGGAGPRASLTVLAHGCYRRSRAGRRAPGGGEPPAGPSAPTSCSGRRRPAGRTPGRRRCGSSAAR